MNIECYVCGDITPFTVCEYSNRIHWKALHMYHMLECCHCARCSLGASHDSSSRIIMSTFKINTNLKYIMQKKCLKTKFIVSNACTCFPDAKRQSDDQVLLVCIQKSPPVLGVTLHAWGHAQTRLLQTTWN